MKATFKALATLLVAAAFTLAGCTEKEKVEPIINDTTSDNPGEETVENILTGTSWTCHMENTYMYQGVLRMEITLDAFLDFNDTLNGELFMDISLDVPQYPQANQSENFTEPFTYKYYGDSVVLYCTYYDEEENDTLHYTYTAIHDTVANTLTLNYNDEGMAEMMGTDQMVFTPLNTTAKRAATNETTHGRIPWGEKMGDLVALTVMLQSLSR